MNHPDQAPCPACGHPVNMHTGDVCLGYRGGAHPCTALTREHVRQARDDQSTPTREPEWLTRGYEHALEGMPADAGLDSATAAALAEQLTAGLSRPLERSVFTGELETAPGAPINDAVADVADRVPFDPRIVQLGPDDYHRDPHDLQVAANALRGAATLTDDNHVAEWLETIAAAFEDEITQQQDGT